jgi:hypothetical protein
MWAIFKERNPSTSNHPHQRKLRRSIGSQPVGSVVGPRQPEVGIAGQVIPSQSPRRTFRSSDDRDLANLANLANLVAGDHGGPTRALISGLYLGLSSAFRKNVERFASAAPQDHAKPSLSRATIQASPQISTLRIIFRSSNPSSRWMPRGTPSHQVVNSGRRKIILILIG